jgi:hypothetical protein
MASPESLAIWVIPWAGSMTPWALAMLPFFASQNSQLDYFQTPNLPEQAN